MLCKYVNYRCPEFFQAGTSFFIVSKITEDRQRDTQIFFFFFPLVSMSFGWMSWFIKHELA